MPFYWRLSDVAQSHPTIPQRMPMRVKKHEEFDFLESEMLPSELHVLELAYREDANIGFITPESGQLNTYGSSFNSFVLGALTEFQPKHVMEIGCGAGLTIKFLEQFGWSVVGVDPSAYSSSHSTLLNFRLIPEFFADLNLEGEIDFVYCNDVFEHISPICDFSSEVYRSLRPGGTFCFSTTASSRSIALGDISILEHQHLNMFTRRSIEEILFQAGFGRVAISKGEYGNTFQVVAEKTRRSTQEFSRPLTAGFVSRAAKLISDFEVMYSQMHGERCFYVPLRCIPYLSSVGDFNAKTFDSNMKWRGKFIGGMSEPIRSLEDLAGFREANFFVGSLTFESEIVERLIQSGVSSGSIQTISSLASRT